MRITDECRNKNKIRLQVVMRQYCENARVQERSAIKKINVH